MYETLVSSDFEVNAAITELKKRPRGKELLESLKSRSYTAFSDINKVELEDQNISIGLCIHYRVLPGSANEVLPFLNMYRSQTKDKASILKMMKLLSSDNLISRRAFCMAMVESNDEKLKDVLLYILLPLVILPGMDISDKPLVIPNRYDVEKIRATLNHIEEKFIQSLDP